MAGPARIEPATFGSPLTDIVPILLSKASYRPVAWARVQCKIFLQFCPTERSPDRRRRCGSDSLRRKETLLLNRGHGAKIDWPRSAFLRIHLTTEHDSWTPFLMSVGIGSLCLHALLRSGRDKGPRR